MKQTLTEQSKEIVSRLIRTDFDKQTGYWNAQEANSMIKLANELGLTELADAMLIDLNI